MKWVWGNSQSDGKSGDVEKSGWDSNSDEGEIRVKVNFGEGKSLISKLVKRSSQAKIFAKWRKSFEF